MHELSKTTIGIGVCVLVLGAMSIGYLLGSAGRKVDIDTTETGLPVPVVQDTLPVTEDAREDVPEVQSKTIPEVGEVVATLNMSGQELAVLPKSLFERTDLMILNLSHNALTGAMPAEIRQLQNLTWLDLSYNQFTGVPAEIGQLSNLRHLDLSHNKLTGLPHELGNLKQLEVLDLTGNEYSQQDLAVIRQGLPTNVRIIGER